MAPPGTKVIIHEKPQQRKTWDPHGTDGWYLGPAMEHYRCYRVFTNKTKAERITDTVEFFPQHTTVPQMNTDEIAIQAAEDLIAAINQPTARKPNSAIGDKQMEAIRQLSDLYQQHTLKQRTQLPRVPPKQHATLPRVAAQPSQQSTTNRETDKTVPPTHRYPTRQQTTSNQEQAHHVITIQDDTTCLSAPTMQPEVHWANAIIDPDTGASMEYRHLLKSPKHREDWTKSFANELGRLAQGVGGRQKGTNTVYYIRHDQVPENRRKDVTYGRICVDYRPQKEEPNRTRLTVGGNLIDDDIL
jgi:hypothetical protein